MFALLRSSTTALMTAAALTTAVLAVPATAAAAPSSPLTIPIVGTAPAGGSFAGTFTLNRFATQNGQLVAVGSLSGIVTDAAGTATSVVTQAVMPAAVTQGTCQILHLDIGPIALNLLGLNVNLSEIVLDITAQSGAGNLLGNLLCSVAGLLDNPSGLANLLNSILGAL